MEDTPLGITFLIFIFVVLFLTAALGLLIWANITIWDEIL